MKKILMVIGLILIITVTGFSWESFNKEDAAVKLFPQAELGFTKVLEHTIQLGDPDLTDPFDYVKQGGQEILFLFQRYSLDLDIVDRHTVTFLYQPLTLETTTVVPESRTGGLTIEDRTYQPGTGLDLKYGFDFWRVSYLYSFISTDTFRLGAGLSLQLRNASIVFSGTEGDSVRVNQNLGPVPIIKIKAEYRFPFGLFLGAEVDGFYASSKIFNGADFDFTGWIYDGALRVGMEVNELTDTFVSFRILGGGASGTSEYDQNFWTDSISGITDNSLTTFIISAGARIK